MTLPPPVFLDPSIPRKQRIIADGYKETDKAVVLPGVVEISESGTCNRTCAFCPRSDPDFPDIKEFIKFELLEKLATQLADCGFDGLIIFSGFVEPLLDKKIFEKLALTKKILPNARIEVITNGDVLTTSVLRRLFESGISTLLISIYDGPEDADKFQKMCEDEGLEDHQFVIRRRYLPPEQDYGITMSNRGGMMTNTEYVRPGLDEPLAETCYYPSYMFFMDYQGDVLLCSHDWGKKYVAGNMNEKDFLDIWLSPAFNTAREQLNQGNRSLAPCRGCDVRGTLMGRDHALGWAARDGYDIPGETEQP
ncbi:MAG: SPASM domain-containing protein [Rhodospirillales bacterium]|nr:SPASM domain-containing protein [Rhodospirillales bacterium]